MNFKLIICILKGKTNHLSSSVGHVRRRLNSLLENALLDIV